MHCKRCSNPAIKKLIDWFCSFASAPLGKEPCLICSLEETPIAFEWLRGRAGAHHCHKEPCIPLARLPAAMLSHINCWKDAASVAYEIFVMMQLWYCVVESEIDEKLTAPSPKPMGEPKKPKSTKRARNQPVREGPPEKPCPKCHTESSARSEADLRLDEEIFEFERRLGRIDAALSCHHQKVTLNAEIFKSLQEAMLEMISASGAENARHPHILPL